MSDKEETTSAEDSAAETASESTEAASESTESSTGSGDSPVGAEKKIAAGICGILLGALGIHKFILGYTTAGVIMLVVTIVGSIIILGPIVMGIIGLIEGILISDQERRGFLSNLCSE